MAIEYRAQNKSHVMTCDRKDCDAEILGDTQDDLHEYASLLGWQSSPDGSKQVCCDCQAGLVGAVQAPIVMQAPMDLAEGQEVVDDDGHTLGYAIRAAGVGTMVELSEVPINPAVGAEAQESAEDSDADVDFFDGIDLDGPAVDVDQDQDADCAGEDGGLIENEEDFDGPLLTADEIFGDMGGSN